MENTRMSFFDEQAAALALQKYMTKVYGWMVGGLAITGLLSYLLMAGDAWMIIASNPILFFGCIIAELALVWSISARVNRISRTASRLLFVLYSALNGVTLSVVVAAYTPGSITSVFIISAAMFAALSLYGTVTKRDLSAMGKFMFMGLIGLIVASILFVFFPSGLLNFVMSVVGVIVFAGLTAYDTQKIRENALESMQDGEISDKGAVVGALMLYLDFINLFLYLLRLLGNRN